MGMAFHVSENFGTFAMVEKKGGTDTKNTARRSKIYCSAEEEKNSQRKNEKQKLKIKIFIYKRQKTRDKETFAVGAHPQKGPNSQQSIVNSLYLKN